MTMAARFLMYLWLLETGRLDEWIGATSARRWGRRNSMLAEYERSVQ